MEKARKTSYKAYAAWNYEKEEVDINENSKNGWQLIKGGCFNTVYKKDNSKQYVYKIDYNAVTMKNSLEKDRYIQMFEELGWEYINSTFNGWNYFKKVYDENIHESEYEIYTDNTSYNDMLNRWCKLGKILLVLELAMAILYTYMSISKVNIVLGVETIFMWALALWIKNGLSTMNNKLKS